MPASVYSKEFIDLYIRGGLSILAIAERFSLTYQQVWRFFKRNNVCIKRKRAKLNDNIFSNITPDACYWAGFLAADGNVRKSAPYVSLQLAIVDVQHIEKFKIFTESDREIKIKTRKQRSGKITQTGSLLIYSHQIKENLNNIFGIIPKKTFIMGPPPYIPEKYINHYIRGYFDGDGSISWHKHNKIARIEIASGSKLLLEWMANNLNKISGNNILIKRKGKTKTFVYSTSGIYAINILNWLYDGSTDSVRLTRKFERFLLYNNIFIENRKKKDEKIKQIEVRKELAIELRNVGYSYESIAKKLKCSLGTIWKDLNGLSTNG